MKRKSLFFLAGIAVLFFTCSQAYAFSEEDMMEGISLSVETNQTSIKSYKYDSANTGAKESMTEYDFFPETDMVKKHYIGDNTNPSTEHILSEGICLTHFAQELASK